MIRPEDLIKFSEREKTHEGRVHDCEVYHEDIIGGDGLSLPVFLEQFPKNSQTCREPKEDKDYTEIIPELIHQYHVLIIAMGGIG